MAMNELFTVLPVVEDAFRRTV